MSIHHALNMDLQQLDQTNRPERN